MIRVRHLLAIALVLGAVSTHLFAEDLDPLQIFDSARKNCADKHYGKCLADLQTLVGEVGRLRTDGLKTLLPAAPADWKAGDAEAISNGGFALLGGGSQVKREYTKGDDKRAMITVTAEAGAMMQGFVMLFQNPAFLGDGKRIVTIKGRKALLDWAKDATSGSLTLLLNVPSSMVQIEANGITSKEIQDVIAASIDLDALEKGIQD